MATTRPRVLRVVALAVALAVVWVVLPRLLARLFYDDVVWALAGWFVQYDLTIFLRAGEAVLDGVSPYPTLEALRDDTSYVYPPLLALLSAPLALLPSGLAASLFTGGGILALVGALLLLGVRDPRCHVLAVLSPLAHEALRWGTISTYLVLAVALAWRFRDRAGGGIATGVAAVLKLFLWPVAVWLALTGRVRGAAVAVATAAVVALASWAVIGFAGLRDYPRLLERLDGLAAAESYSTVALAGAAGLSETAGRLIAIAACVLLLLLAARVARTGRDGRERRDARSLSLCLAAALVLSPIVWLHYLVLLFVPLALARPRLSPLWLLPLALWPFMAAGWFGDWPAGDVGELLVAWALAALIVAAAVAPQPLPHVALARLRAVRARST
jgi:alpha-1,2-mannosyltransferase